MAWSRLFVLLGTAALFSGSASAGLKAKTVQSCTQLSLKKMTCVLTTTEAELSLSATSVTVAVGAASQNTMELPVQGAGTQWESIQLLDAAGRLFVQLLIWGPPGGADQQQELHWFVFEIANGKLVARVSERNIQTRAPAAEDEESGQFKRTHGERIGIEQDETGQVYAVRGKTRVELR